MEGLIEIASGAGYAVFFAIGFAEFVGVPLAGGPALLAAGALASNGRVDPLLAVAGAAAGALLGDALWYAAARGAGPRLVRIFARVSRNPARLEARMRRFEGLGPGWLFPAKFVPGVGALAACAAALGGMGARRFLLFDGASVLVWAGLYVSAGFLFGAEVARLLS